jgi:hypothetical protein
MTDATTIVLTVAFRHTINEANIEAGYSQFVALAGFALHYDAFCDAIAACLSQGLISEPIRLPEGALQCHWRLELTPAGVAAARSRLACRGRTGPTPDP